MGKEQPQGLLLGEVPYINKKLWDGSEVKFTVKADPDYKKGMDTSTFSRPSAFACVRDYFFMHYKVLLYISLTTLNSEN